MAQPVSDVLMCVRYFMADNLKMFDLLKFQQERIPY
jgi:hypothetical protein